MVGGPLVVIFLAGLQGIPQELYEQAEIDGAKMRHRLIAVTLPMISPVLLFNLVIGCIHATQLFVEPLVMTGGGPNNATLTLLLYLYRNAFAYLKMGYAAGKHSVYPLGGGFRGAQSRRRKSRLSG